jgi:hypothetical protein
MVHSSFGERPIGVVGSTDRCNTLSGCLRRDSRGFSWPLVQGSSLLTAAVPERRSALFVIFAPRVPQGWMSFLLS